LRSGKEKLSRASLAAGRRVAGLAHPGEYDSRRRAARFELVAYHLETLAGEQLKGGAWRA
jgi:hypothetical protein